MPPRKPPGGGNVVPINPADRPAPTSGRKKPTRGAATKTEPRNIVVARRREDALGLRRAGLSFTKIAEMLAKKYGQPGYVRASAYRDVRVGLDMIVEEPARELLEEELSRLMAAQAALWPQVMRGEIPAVLALLRIMDRRSRYIGLDSPIKQQLTGPDGSPLVAINLTDPADLYREGLGIVEELVAAKQQRRRDKPASSE